MVKDLLRSTFSDLHEGARHLASFLDYGIWRVFDKSRKGFFGEPGSVLVVLINKQAGNVGGDFATFGVLKNLKRENPGLKISLLGDKNTIGQFKGNKGVDLIEYKGKRTLGDLKKKGFDSMVFLNSGGKVKLEEFNFIPMRIGKNVNSVRGFFNFENRFGFTDKVFNGATKHMVDLRYGLVEALGFKVRDKKLEFENNKKEHGKVERFLKKNRVRKFIIIHPGGKHMVETLDKGGWPPHLWNLERYAEVADHFSRKGYKVLVTGAPGEKEIGERIGRLASRKIINCCGEFNLKETGALLKRAKLLISTDTGIVHIAYQTGVPIVELMGPSVPEAVGAWPLNSKKHKILVDNGPASRSLRKLPYKDNFNCLERIKVKEVIRAGEKLLKGN